MQLHFASPGGKILPRRKGKQASRRSTVMDPRDAYGTGVIRVESEEESRCGRLFPQALMEAAQFSASTSSSRSRKQRAVCCTSSSSAFPSGFPYIAG